MDKMLISKREVVLGAPDRVNIPCLMHDTRLCQYQQHHIQEGRGEESTRKCSEEALGGSFKVVTIPITPSYQYDPLMLLKHKYEDIKNEINTATNQSSIMGICLYKFSFQNLKA